MNAINHYSKASGVNQDHLGQRGICGPHINKITAEILPWKHSTTYFLIAIYHSEPCKLFHYLKSADWYGFCTIRSALCNEMGTGSVPQIHAVKRCRWWSQQQKTQRMYKARQSPTLCYQITSTILTVRLFYSGSFSCPNKDWCRLPKINFPSFAYQNTNSAKIHEWLQRQLIWITYQIATVRAVSLWVHWV